MCLFYTKLDYAASGGELNPKKRIKEILNKLLRTGLIEEIEGRTVKYFAKPFL
jgi:predicted transcriptional regulator